MGYKPSRKLHNSDQEYDKENDKRTYGKKKRESKKNNDVFYDMKNVVERVIRKVRQR